MSPKLTVVFPTYNRPDDVQLTLKALADMLTVSYEVIIIDNSPEPAAFSLAENERQIVTGENLGTAARNIGIAEAQGEYILQLDDDSSPLAGATEAALAHLEQAPERVGGVTSRVERPDGGRENPPLLPTVFHGCGVLFRTSMLRAIGDLYPDSFCFYGEEYWSTLKIYQHGYVLDYLDEFRVCHRMSAVGRDKGRILYYLTINNRRTWRGFVPDDLLEIVEQDTLRRYELICAKECVDDSYEKAVSDEIEEPAMHKMTRQQFEEYALLDRMQSLLDEGKFDTSQNAVLCGLGKFPTLWRQQLLAAGLPEVVAGDFNPSFAGHDYFGQTVLSPDELLDRARSGSQVIIGHSARADSDRWIAYLAENGVTEYVSLDI